MENFALCNLTIFIFSDPLSGPNLWTDPISQNLSYFILSQFRHSSTNISLCIYPCIYPLWRKCQKQRVLKVEQNDKFCGRFPSNLKIAVYLVQSFNFLTRVLKILHCGHYKKSTLFLWIYSFYRFFNIRL